MMTLRDIARIRSAPGLNRVIRQRYEGDTDALVMAIDRGLTNLLRTDLKRAGRYLTHAERCFALLPEVWRPRFWALQARHAHFTGQFMRARDLYGKVLAQYEKRKDRAAAARIHRALIEVSMYVGRYKEALAHGRRALRYFSRQGLDNEAAQVMTNIGNVYHRLDRNRDALRMYDKARAVFARSGGVPLAIVDYNRANVYANLNDIRQARALYRAAAGRYEKAGMELAGAQARYSLAYLLFLEDAFSQSLQTFERVHEAFVRYGDRRSAAVTQLDLAEINLRLNQYGLAVLAAETVAPLFHALGMRYEEGKAELFAAAAHLAMRNPTRAATCLRVARQLFAREQNDLWQGMVAQLEATIEMSRGRFSRAEQGAKRARHWFRRCDDPRRQVDAAIVGLHAALRLQRRTAVAGLMRLLKQRNLISMQRFTIHEILGEHYLKKEDTRKALSHYRQATTVAEKMLSGLQEDEIRFFFAANKYHVYTRAVECMLALGRVKASWLFSMRALSLMNSPMVSSRRLQRQLPPHMIENISRLRQTLNRVRRLPRSGERSAAAMSSSVLEQRLWAQERRARALVHTGGAAKRHGGAGNDPGTRLRPGETLINYLTVSDVIGAQVATPQGVRFIPLDVTAGELDALLRKLHFISEQTVHSSRRGTDLQTAMHDYLSQLHRYLIAPLAGAFDSGPVMVFAEGPAAQVPFAVLRDTDGRYLSENHELRLVVNPDTIGPRRQRNVRYDLRRNAVLAVPSPSLPQVQQEAEAIVDLFEGAELVTAEAATAAVLQQKLSVCKGFVHIATHASRSSENPLFSRLLMADGPFFPFDLHARGVSAELVVLSGCQTAAPGLYYGNSFSLAKAFHQAGARYVLASLWPVSDRLTMVFMQVFYRCLSETGNPPQAWQAAMNKLMQFADDPADWGAFVLLGV